MIYRLLSANIITFIFFCLTSCQPGLNNEVKKEISNLSSDNGQLDLSQFSFEQQKMESDKAANSLIAVREKRIILDAEENKDFKIKSKINIAIYARKTNNIIGKRIHNRLKTKKEYFRKCSHFSTSDDAQRYFLSNGGPKKDYMGLDPDGDGFACKWDPIPFRKINISTD
jgi:hypothetical protein